MEAVYSISKELKSGEKRLEFNIALTNSGVKFLESEDNELGIECDGLRKNTFEDIFDVSFENDMLKITEKSKNKEDGILGFKFNFGGQGNQNYTIDIYLPKGIKTEGKIELTNGSIRGEELDYNGTFKQVNGDCKFSKLIGNDFRYSNVNGCLTLDEFVGSTQKISFVNGAVVIKSGKIEAMVVSGVNGNIDIKADFDLKEDGKVSNVSGNIKLDFDSYLGENIFKIKSLSGDISLNGDYPEDKVVKKSEMKMKAAMGAMKSIAPMMGNIFKAMKKGNFGQELKFDVKTDVKKDKSREENIEKILDMLSEGKITYEQSQNLINAL